MLHAAMIAIFVAQAIISAYPSPMGEKQTFEQWRDSIPEEERYIFMPPVNGEYTAIDITNGYWHGLDEIKAAESRLGVKLDDTRRKMLNLMFKHNVFSKARYYTDPETALGVPTLPAVG